MGEFCGWLGNAVLRRTYLQASEAALLGAETVTLDLLKGAALNLEGCSRANEGERLSPLFEVEKAAHSNCNRCFGPSTFNADWTEPCKIAVVVQAKSLDGDSLPLRLEISWDGKWSDDAAQMKRHLTWVAK